VTLQALADSLQAQLKGRRAVEVERSKPYVVVRQVTIISLATLVLVFAGSPAFFAPYRTPLGQALLSVLLISYIGSLLMMRRKARQPARLSSAHRRPPMIISLVLLSGMLLAGGLSCLVIAFARSIPRLEAALEMMGGDGTETLHPSDVGPISGQSERLGAFLYRVVPIPLSNGQRGALRLQDKSIPEFYAEKAVMAIIGALLPGLVGAAFAYLTGHLSVIPALAAVVGGAIGFFVPDLALRRTTARVQSGATEALLVYIGSCDLGAADQRLGHPGAAERRRIERRSALRPDPYSTRACTT
jgi:hypothetical protein